MFLLVRQKRPAHLEEGEGDRGIRGELGQEVCLSWHFVVGETHGKCDTFPGQFHNDSMFIKRLQ